MRRASRPTRWAAGVVAVTGVASGTLGLLGLVGWLAGVAVLVQATAAPVAIQPGAALVLVLCAAGLLMLAGSGWSRPAVVTGALASLLGLAALAGLDIGIDRLLARPAFLAGAAGPGRMSPSTALCATLAGAALVLAGAAGRARLKQAPLFAGLLGSVVFAFGVVAFTRYLTRAPAPDGFGPMVGMAVQAAAGFAALGAGIMTHAWRIGSADDPVSLHWLPLLVGAGAVAVSASVWHALVVQERAQLRGALDLAAASARDGIAHGLDDQVQGLARLARRWEHRGPPPRAAWEFDAGLLLGDDCACQAIQWIDPSLHVRWIVPMTGNEAAGSIRSAFDEPRRQALAAALARRSPTATRTVDLVKGGKGFLVYVPIFRGGQFGGLIVGVFRSQDLLDRIAAWHVLRGYGIAVFDGEQEVYSRGAGRQHEAEWGRDAEVGVYGVAWRIRIWPSPALLGRVDSRAPEVALAVGLLLALLLALAVHFAHAARIRARQAEAASRRLAFEVVERERAEEAVRRRDERFRLLIEHALDDITVLDRDGTIRYKAPSVQRLLGYRPEELVGTNAFDHLHKDDVSDVARVFAEALDRPGVGLTAEFRVRHKDGSWRVFEATGTNLLDNPRVAGVVVNGRDVTARRSLEAQLRQSQKMEAVGRLAGGIAHDFNNILMAITGYSELLAARLDVRDPRRRYAEEICRSAERAAALTRQLLAFSRRQVLRPTVLDLNGVVRGMEAMLRPLIGEQIELVTVLCEGVGLVRADLAQLEQVIVNLAVNARDAMPQGGTLTLEVAGMELDEAAAAQRPGGRPGAYVTLAVRDTGCGMDAATRAHLFEPFFTTKEVGKGTGLGLATVYGIVEQSGGSVRVDTEPGRGTTFTICLPRVEGAVVRPAAPEGEGPRGLETVLLAEDEAAVRTLVREVLECHGYTVLEAGDGEEALAVSARHAGPIDLLVADVVMPRMSGPALAARLSRARPGVRVLYLSGYAAQAGRWALDPGAVFLEKPIAPGALARRVREVIEAPGGRQGSGADAARD